MGTLECKVAWRLVGEKLTIVSKPSLICFLQTVQFRTTRQILETGYIFERFHAPPEGAHPSVVPPSQPLLSRDDPITVKLCSHRSDNRQRL